MAGWYSVWNTAAAAIAPTAIPLPPSPPNSPNRPERITPRPHIDGTLPARVTAAENCTYAYIDDMGRYRVKLPFDLDEWSPGGESRPVRLAKPYAGPEYGIPLPLTRRHRSDAVLRPR